MEKILFVLKRPSDKEDYSTNKHTGLFNSCVFLVELLNDIGFEAILDFAVDGNYIEKLVVKYRPDVVILEALWVTPDKVIELSEIYPNIMWLIRIHSDMPFLANEGIAIEWILNYTQNSNIYVAFNNEKTFKYFSENMNKNNYLYLPNWYPHDRISSLIRDAKNEDGYFHIGCFGAIRPLKNQLIQACAAIKYAQQLNLKIKFHMNTTRIENNGLNVLKNIRALFNNGGENYILVEHEWKNHDDFLKIVDQMDIGMQVSLSETFNIITADFVARNKPIVVSEEIDWVNSLFRVKTVDVDHIVAALHLNMDCEFLKLRKLNNLNLINYNHKSKKIWLNTFGD